MNLIGRKTSQQEHPVFLALGFLRMKKDKKKQVLSHATEKHKRFDWAAWLWARHNSNRDGISLGSLCVPNAGQWEQRLFAWSCYQCSQHHQPVCLQEQFVISPEILILSDYRPVCNLSNFGFQVWLEVLDKQLYWDLVHTTPEIFKNAALFLRLGLPPTIICHENGRSSNGNTV